MNGEFHSGGVIGLPVDPAPDESSGELAGAAQLA
jgi:hypothetical protein